MRSALALAALLVSTSCFTTPSPTPSPIAASATPTAAAIALDMTETLARTRLPAHDPFALTRQLRGRDGTPGPWEPVRAAPPARAVGDTESFFVVDFRAKRHDRISATIRHVSEHAYWYVQEGVPADPARLAQTALRFDGQIYPTTRGIYGEEWTPGIDNDPRLTILFARIPDVGGYFSASDSYPRWVNPFSAERDMFYINIDAAPPGSTFLHSTLAHEFAHMIQFNKRRRSAGWFLEGHAQLAEEANGFAVRTHLQFLSEPDTQLDDWVDEPPEVLHAHYGHSYLFLHYLSERFGGTTVVKELMERDIDTPLDIDAVLRGRASSMDEAYLDFVVANALLDQRNAPAPYRYGQLRATGGRAGRERAVEPGEPRAGSVHQYAARYFELPAGQFTVRFAGTTSVKILPTDPHSGRHLWWGNRADSVDTRLMRKVDLRGTDRATLRFWTWYDIERNFDYAYVSVSEDGGKTWRPVKGTLTTEDDPLGQNYGNGITGVSGGGDRPTWVQERMDLTPWARKEILLRFDYVTDLVLARDGFAVDDLEIAEIGWRDDAEAPGEWQAEGFVRSSNLVRERFAVQAIRLGDAAAVDRVLANADGLATLSVDVPRGGALLAVTALGLQTRQPGAFELRLERR